MNIYQKSLEQAVKVKGTSLLMRHLGISETNLHLWLQGKAPIPAWAKSKIIDLVVDADGSAPAVPRVLVVDDDASSAYGLVRVVRALGYSAVTALSAQEAIEKARMLEPQVILLNLPMPGIDGCELARGLSSGSVKPRIIAATAYGELDERQKTSAAGFVAYLVKPIDTSMLEPYLPPLASATMR